MALIAIDPGKATGFAAFDASDPLEPWDGIDRLKLARACSFEGCLG